MNFCGLLRKHELYTTQGSSVRLVHPMIEANMLNVKGFTIQYIGADFSLLESQTSYIGFEFPARWLE